MLNDVILDGLSTVPGSVIVKKSHTYDDGVYVSIFVYEGVSGDPLYTAMSSLNGTRSFYSPMTDGSRLLVRFPGYSIEKHAIVTTSGTHVDAIAGILSVRARGDYKLQLSSD